MTPKLIERLNAVLTEYNEDSDDSFAISPLIAYDDVAPGIALMQLYQTTVHLWMVKDNETLEQTMRDILDDPDERAFRAEQIIDVFRMRATFKLVQTF